MLGMQLKSSCLALCCFSNKSILLRKKSGPITCLPWRNQTSPQGTRILNVLHGQLCLNCLAYGQPSANVKNKDPVATAVTVSQVLWVHEGVCDAGDGGFRAPMFLLVTVVWLHKGSNLNEFPTFDHVSLALKKQLRGGGDKVGVWN